MDLIFNWDQTGLNLVPAASWSMAPKSAKRVKNKWLEIKGRLLQ